MEKELAQIASKEERETHIWVDYYNAEVRIFTNVAVVIRRLEKHGFKPTDEELVDGLVYGRTYTLPLKSIGLVAKKGLFYIGSADKDSEE